MVWKVQFFFALLFCNAETEYKSVRKQKSIRYLESEQGVLRHTFSIPVFLGGWEERG